jgi:hypothetical protein
MITRKKLLRLATTLLLATALTTPANAQKDPLRTSDHEAATAVAIRSEADLREYLSAEPANSPLKYFSAGAKQRFIEGLRFGAGGAAGFNRQPIQDELTEAEAREVLALFGLQDYASSIEGLGASRDSVTHAEIVGNDAGGATPEIRQFFRRLVEFDADTAKESRSSFTRREYAKVVQGLGAPHGCSSQTNLGELHTLFAAALGPAMYVSEPAYFEQLERCYQLLEKQHATRRSEHMDMYKAMILYRRFDEAQAFADAHADLQLRRMPSVIDHVGLSKPSVFEIDPSNGMSLRRRPFKSKQGFQLIVVASPGCHFSQAAATDISKNAELVRDMHGAVWLGAPDELLHFDAVAEWNQAHPATPMVVANSALEFSELDLSTYPTFYFLENGKVVDKISGWESAAQAEVLKHRLERWQSTSAGLRTPR